MADKRSHRGAHPDDQKLFDADRVADLRSAVVDLSWLLSRGYAQPSTLKLVGDRYELTKRQRSAVMRSACSDEALAKRSAGRCAESEAGGRALLIDGYNVLTTVEAALGAGVTIIGRDGCMRDIASMHGTWRKVGETEPAIELIGRTLADLGVTQPTWLLDKPVSNSGRLRGIMLKAARQHGWAWSIELLNNPDRAMIDRAGDGVIVATADSAVLDRCGPFLDLARIVVERGVKGAWVIDLS